MQLKFRSGLLLAYTVNFHCPFAYRLTLTCTAACSCCNNKGLSPRHPGHRTFTPSGATVQPHFPCTNSESCVPPRCPATSCLEIQAQAQAPPHRSFNKHAQPTNQPKLFFPPNTSTLVNNHTNHHGRPHRQKYGQDPVSSLTIAFNV